MSTRQPSELLYDSEATLRLVDSAILDMGELGGEETPALQQQLRIDLVAPPDEAIGFAGLSDVLVHGYTEVVGVLHSLRQSRHQLERAAVEKVQQPHDRLLAVSSATETAATDILNGLERASAMVDDLDAIAGEHSEPGEPGDRGRTIRTALRDELFALVGHMQFQDITSQQLTYASAVLTDMEVRLAHLARVFDPAVFGISVPTHAAPQLAAAHASVDPNASTQNRAERQAVADAIVATTAS